MTKKTLISTVLAGALAISCIGISSGLRVEANAEELSANSSVVSPASANSISVPAPVFGHVEGFGMVQYTWTAEQCSYLYVSPEGNWNAYSSEIPASNGYAIYKEVQVSPINSSGNPGISQKFAKSLYRDSGGDGWESSIAAFTASYSSGHAVSLSIVSGAITTSYTTYSHSGTEGQFVYITGAYAGEMANCTTLYQLNSNNAGKSVTVTAGSVTYTVIIGLNSFRIKASRVVTCSRVSTSLNNYGALAICFDTP